MLILEIFFIVVMIASLFYVAMIYTSQALLLCTFLAALFSVLSFVYLIYVRCGIKTDITSPIDVADEGEAVKVRLTVTSLNSRIIPKCQFHIWIRNCNEKASVFVGFRASDITEGKNVFDYEIKFKDAGCYEVAVKKVRIYDLFGMIYCTKKVSSKAYVRIMPEPALLDVTITEPVRHFFGDSDEHDAHTPGHDNSEIFGIREYMAGDKIQTIHWKLTAKEDELMVKEMSLPKACPVVLFLERGKGNTFSSFLHIIAGISFSLVEAACPHYIAWFDEEVYDVVRQRVDSAESYYLFFYKYLKEHKEKNAETVRELYDSKFRYERYVYGLSINDDLTVTDKDRVLLNTDADNLKADLGGMELVF